MYFKNKGIGSVENMCCKDGMCIGVSCMCKYDWIGSLVCVKRGM